MRYRWYDLERKELLKLLRTDEEKGLGRKEAAERLKTDGKNTVNPVMKAPIRGYILEVVSDLTAVLMLIAAVLAVIYERDMGAIAMLVLLIFNYFITIVSYVRSQKILEELGHRAQPTAKVIRNGKLTVISEESVVQGDIFLLSVGDIVPCDARLLEAENLRVLEGNLFGNENSSLKDAEYIRAGLLKPDKAVNMVYASTVVTGGRGKAVAVLTGPDTLVSRLKKNKPIAAAHKLEVISKLKKISSVVGLAVLLPVFVLTFIEMLRGGQLIEVFLSSLAFAVSAMPEMYIAFVYVIVAFGMMAVLGKRKRGEERKGVFLKNPLILPELCSPDCLLLPLESFFLEKESSIISAFDGEKILEEQTDLKNPEYLRVLRYGIISTGLYEGKRLNLRNEQSENIYSRSEEAIIEACERAGIYNKSLEESYPIEDHRDAGEDGSLFDTTLVRYNGQDVVVLRGEPEAVLARCTGYVRQGKVFSMDAYAKNELLGIASAYLKRHCQPIAIATKNSNYNSLLRIVDCQSDLIFEGYLMLEKPLLPGAAKEILRLREAGIKVLAYSANESEENRFLAKALGIVTEEKQQIRATELPGMKEEIYKIGLKDYTLFEGFNGPQLKYTVECLASEYQRKTGFCAADSEGIYAIYSASVGFSTDNGQTLGRTEKEKREGELHAPLWNKTGKRNDQIGCQALNSLSDVILPPVDRKGSGGINAIGTAIRTARGIYRKIYLLLIYLAFSNALRFLPLLFTLTGTMYLTPVEMLTMGLVFDLGAVFVMAFEGTGRKYEPVFEKSKTKRLLAIPSAVIAGAGASFAVMAASRIMESAGWIAKEQISAVCFLSMLILLAGVLTALLRWNKPAFKNIRFTAAYSIYLLLFVVFFLMCAFLPFFGSVFGTGALRGKVWAAISVSAFAASLLIGVGKAIVRRTAKNKNKR